MAITYTGTNGLFTRLGKLFYIHELMETFQGNLRTEIEDVLDEFTNTDMWQLGSLPAKYKTFDSTLKSNFLQIQDIANTILMESVNTGLSVQANSIQQALWYLIQDMKGSQYVEAVNYGTNGTVGAGGSNAGGGTVIVNSVLPKNIMSTATAFQTIRGEVLNLECVRDESSGTTLGREEFEVRGDESKPKFDYDWPAGSGIRKIVPVTAAKSDGNLERYTGPGRNILRNSDFQTWESSNVISNWTSTQVGSAVFAGGTGPQTKNTTAAYIWNSESSGDLQLNGDSSGWKHKIYQELNSPTGTRGRVLANKCYIFSCRVRIAAGSGTVGGSAAMTFAVENAASSKLSSASKTLDVGAIGTSWTHVTEEWNLTETEIPADARFTMEITTAIPNTKAIVIDEMVLAERVQVYPGGPGFIIVRGDDDYRNGDTHTITYAHSASPPANKWQFYFDRFFNTSSYNYNLPSAGGSAIADSLIG